jgi:hypothetical protein
VWARQLRDDAGINLIIPKKKKESAAGAGREATETKSADMTCDEALLQDADESLAEVPAETTIRAFLDDALATYGARKMRMYPPGKMRGGKTPQAGRRPKKEKSDKSTQ